MRLGIFAKTFEGSEPQEIFAAAVSAGYSTVQYNMTCSGLAAMPDDISSEAIEMVSSAAKSKQIDIAALSGTFNMIHPDPKIRALGHHRLEVLSKAAKAFPTRLITLCTGTRDPDDQWRHHPDNQGESAWRDLLTEMGKAADLAEAHGVDLGIEPELANVVNSAEAARRLLNDLKSPRLRIVLDPANLFETVSEDERKNIIAHAVETLAGRISMAHAKDRDASGGFVAAGTGVIDFPHFIAALKKAGFDGPLVAHGLSEVEAPAVAKFLHKAMGA